MGGYSTPARFYSLDALRGIAAVIVVVFHYRNLLTVNGKFPPDYLQDALPIHGVLSSIYERGWLAVDFFFVLSGFIFFWLYAQKIYSRQIRFAAFAGLRIARLYPLHLAMLLLVAIGQALITARSDGTEYFQYATNTSYFFVLHLFFVSAWGFGSPYSFNGPVWSISVEIFLYLVFFLLALVRPARLLIIAAVAAIGFLAMWKFGTLLGRGMFAFFIGGAVYRIYKRAITWDRVAFACRLAVLACVVAWLGVLLAIVDSDLGPLVPSRLVPVLMVLFVFPTTVLALALRESRGPTILKPLSFLGDISYSMYLVHFPLQLVLYIVLSSFGVDRSIVYSGAFFLIFFALLLPLSIASYRYVERPLQDAIRDGFRRSGTASLFPR